MEEESEQLLLQAPETLEVLKPKKKKAELKRAMSAAPGTKKNTKKAKNSMISNLATISIDGPGVHESV